MVEFQRSTESKSLAKYAIFKNKMVISWETESNTWSPALRIPSGNKIDGFPLVAVQNRSGFVQAHHRQHPWCVVVFLKFNSHFAFEQLLTRGPYSRSSEQWCGCRWQLVGDQQNLDLFVILHALFRGNAFVFHDSIHLYFSVEIRWKSRLGSDLAIRLLEQSAVASA